MSLKARSSSNFLIKNWDTFTLQTVTSSTASIGFLQKHQMTKMTMKRLKMTSLSLSTFGREGMPQTWVG